MSLKDKRCVEILKQGKKIKFWQFLFCPSFMTDSSIFNRILYLFNKNIPSNISKNLYSPLFLRLFSLFYVF